MARERGLGHEVPDCVRIARQQMAGDGETTGDVAEALPVLCVQEQRADAGRPNRRHGGTNNPIGTAASLKPRTAAGRGQGSQVVYHLETSPSRHARPVTGVFSHSLRRTRPTAGGGGAATHWRHAWEQPPMRGNLSSPGIERTTSP